MKSAMELIPQQLQDVRFDEPVVARAVSLAKPSNDKVREAADARLAFEDEPAAYLKFLSEKS